MARTPSPQQAGVYQWVKTGRGNAIIPAVAGSGKTTTLLNAASLMSGSVAFAAYNKKIADEIGSKLANAGVGKNVRASTFHSFGFSAWRRVAAKVVVSDKKIANIMETIKVPDVLETFVPKLVSLAKNHAIGVLTPFDDHMAWHRLVQHHELDEELPEDAFGTDTEDLLETGIATAKQVLQASTQMDLEVIDFDDMLYAPLFHSARVWQNDWILVDECQDTNPSRRAFAKKMLRPGGRAIFVGDPHQAIYGFTGADNDSMEIIRREFNCTELPLTVTYRCPKSVVTLAQTWVNHITAADSAPDGAVQVITDEDFYKTVSADTLRAGMAVLCRNTKPLVTLCFDLIRRQIPCHVEGKDIGRGLVALASRWRIKRLTALVEKLDDYLRRESQKFLAKGQEQKADALFDKVETLKVIIHSLPADGTLDDLKTTIARMFGDTSDLMKPQGVTLSTVHKSKGREWGTVYLWGRNKYMPSPYARQAWQYQQENNLIYVAVTRAMDTLVEVMVTAK